MPTQALLVLTTLGSADEARNFVTGLVADRLVACGTVLSKGTSIYWWEGAITEEDEVVVLLKTDASKWDELSAAVEERHPYEVPELLAVSVEEGLERYLAWLTAEVTA
jgi:periplasmic divalent cation tolerance protein